MKRTILALAFATLSRPALAAESCVIAGSPGAPLTIEEFADFHCPYCAKGSATIRGLVKDYPGKVRLVFRNLPLPFHGHGAVAAAKAMAAACFQGAAVAGPFEEKLFERQAALVHEGEKAILAAAKEAGADVKRLQADMGGEAAAASVAHDEEEAARSGITGTPAFLVGAELIMGAQPPEEFRKVIERQLGR